MSIDIRWYGTATIEYKHKEGSILVDPFIPLNGSEHQVSISEYDGFSDILVTHGHFDHIVNIPEIIARNPNTTVYCTETPYQTLQKKGVPCGNLVLINYGDKLLINGFSIEVFHAKHAVLPTSSLNQLKRVLTSGNLKNLPNMVRELLQCKENDETVMYQLEADGQRIQHMGSMNLREDVSYPKGADILMLPYNGWADNLPPAEWVVSRLKPEKIILHHFDNTFPPLTWDLDLDPAFKRFGDMVELPEYCNL